MKFVSFLLLKKNYDWIEIFQMFQIFNPGGWQQVFQYKGKKVISKLAPDKRELPILGRHIGMPA